MGAQQPDGFDPHLHARMPANVGRGEVGDRGQVGQASPGGSARAHLRANDRHAKGFGQRRRVDVNQHAVVVVGLDGPDETGRNRRGILPEPALRSLPASRAASGSCGASPARRSGHSPGERRGDALPAVHFRAGSRAAGSMVLSVPPSSRLSSP